MDNVNFGMNVFCGPAVLSIFTGLDTDTCAEAISKVNGQHTIKGVTPIDLIAAADKLGVEIKKNDAFQGRSLFWTASALVHFPKSMWCIVIPRHYIAIEVQENGTIQICDNHTKEPIDLQNSARLSQRVEAVYKVKRVREYIKPFVVSEELVVEEMFGSVSIYNKQVYNTGEDKIKGLGDILTTDRDVLQQIAFKLMELCK